MVNNLFIFWPTVLKTYLMEIQYKNTHLDFTLHGDVYFLPKDVEENHLKGEKNFYVDLQDKIKSKVGNKATELTPSKLAAYHEVFSNSSYKFDKRINQENYKIIKEYIKDAEPIKIKYAVVDKYKVLFWLLAVPLLILSLGNILHEKFEDPQKKEESELKFKQEKLKFYIDDKHSPIKSLLNKEDETDLHDLNQLSGVWFSYNESNLAKDSNVKKPFDQIKWKFEMGSKQMKITREFSDGNKVSTHGFGVAEIIDGRYYFNLNIYDEKEKKIFGKRQFICNLVKPKGEGGDTEPKLLECLCTLLSTQTDKEDFIISREILEFKTDSRNKYTTYQSKNLIREELPIYIRKYFPKDVPSFLQRIEKDSVRFRLQKKLNTVKIESESK